MACGHGAHCTGSNGKKDINDVTQHVGALNIKFNSYVAIKVMLVLLHQFL
jgi:hypothetical protein